MTDEGERFKVLKVEENPQYTEIDMDSLKELIQKGYTIQEMADEFKVGNTVIYNRINELGYEHINEARIILGGMKLYEPKNIGSLLRRLYGTEDLEILKNKKEFQ